MNTLLQMESLTKIYPDVLANDRVSFDVVEGEIHALLGENGAGKTTLMNILYGLTAPDEGQIVWQGEPVKIDSPKKATQLGIGMVHQHFMLVQCFNALQNIVLGETGGGPWLNLKNEAKQIKALAEEYSLDIDFETEVQNLPLGMQQRIEILKALYHGAHLLVMDEPTAVLTPDEVEKLFEILRRLAGQGHATIFISHKLEEVLAISDRITVLRDGCHIATLPTAEATKPKLAQLMVGRPVVLEVEKNPAEQRGKVVIDVDDVWLERESGRDQLHGVTLRVEAGQILGLAGIDGNGQRALLEILCGLLNPTRGHARLLDTNLSSATPRNVTEMSVGRIPEDRTTMGLIPSLSIWENLVLEKYHCQPLARWGVMHPGCMKTFAKGLVEEFDIRTPNVEAAANNLSGGNQQKLILARELHRNPDVLIVANPTRGVDVGAIEYTYRRILNGRDRGMGVLLISSDLEEILCLSDRIAVIHGGRIMGEIPAEQAERSQLGMMMTGTPLEAIPA
jgi:ABC-type uncharacterized transport system ATPase subunit